MTSNPWQEKTFPVKQRRKNRVPKRDTKREESEDEDDDYETETNINKFSSIEFAITTSKPCVHMCVCVIVYI